MGRRRKKPLVPEPEISKEQYTIGDNEMTSEFEQDCYTSTILYSALLTSLKEGKLGAAP